MKLGKALKGLQDLKKTDETITKNKKLGNRFHYGGLKLAEKFVSLGDALRIAVKLKFGKGYWVQDFSRTEVIVWGEENQANYKTAYKIVKGMAEFPGVLQKVTRITTYEATLEDFVALANMEVEAKKALKKE